VDSNQKIVKVQQGSRRYQIPRAVRCCPLVSQLSSTQQGNNGTQVSIVVVKLEEIDLKFEKVRVLGHDLQNILRQSYTISDDITILYVNLTHEKLSIPSDNAKVTIN